MMNKNLGLIKKEMVLIIKRAIKMQIRITLKIHNVLHFDFIVEIENFFIFYLFYISNQKITFNNLFNYLFLIFVLLK